MLQYSSSWVSSRDRTNTCLSLMTSVIMTKLLVEGNSQKGNDLGAASEVGGGRGTTGDGIGSGA